MEKSWKKYQNLVDTPCIDSKSIDINILLYRSLGRILMLVLFIDIEIFIDSC